MIATFGRRTECRWPTCVPSASVPPSCVRHSVLRIEIKFKLTARISLLRAYGKSLRGGDRPRPQGSYGRSGDDSKRGAIICRHAARVAGGSYQQGEAQVRGVSCGSVVKPVTRAGDENRTRTISLGSGAVTTAEGTDLLILVASSSRDCPLVTLANGTLMARRSCATRQPRERFSPLHLPRPPRSCQPLAVAVVSRLAKRPRQRLGLDAATQPRSSEARRAHPQLGRSGVRDRRPRRSGHAADSWQLARVNDRQVP
jgi:hypothetical protein